MFPPLSSCSFSLNDKNSTTLLKTDRCTWSLCFSLVSLLSCSSLQLLVNKYNIYFVRRLLFLEISLVSLILVLFLPPLVKPPLLQKRKTRNFSSGLICRIGTLRESRRNILISQRGDEFGGICQTLWSEMNYANELFGPGCLQKPLGRTQNSKDTEASAFQAPPVHWEDNTVSSLLICFTVETHTQAYIHIDSFFLSFFLSLMLHWPL